MGLRMRGGRDDSHQEPYKQCIHKQPMQSHDPSRLFWPNGRGVSANGGIRWNRPWMHVSITCTGAYLGREEIDDGGGTSPSGRSCSADGWNDTCASKRPMGDAHDTGVCDPCLRTILCPISPTGQHGDVVCPQLHRMIEQSALDSAPCCALY